MPSHSLIELYTKRFRDNVDEAWQDIRALHEQGYELMSHQELELIFLRSHTCICPVAMAGRLVWVHSLSNPVYRLHLHDKLLHGGLHFDSALAVASWWEVELSNQPEPATTLPPPNQIWPGGPPAQQQPIQPLGIPPAPPQWGSVTPRQQAELDRLINAGAVPVPMTTEDFYRNALGIPKP